MGSYLKYRSTYITSGCLRGEMQLDDGEIFFPDNLAGSAPCKTDLMKHYVNTLVLGTVFLSEKHST